MPAWITPLLCVVWCSPSARPRSRTTPLTPRTASPRAPARRTRPRRRASLEQVGRRADGRFGVDLVVLVQLADVAGLAEALDAEAGHRHAVDRGQGAQP